MDDRTNTTIRETHVRERGTSSGMAFILGAVVLGLVIVGFVLYGGFDRTPTSGDAGGTTVNGDTNVVIETPAPTADAPAADAPASDAAPATTGN